MIKRLAPSFSVDLCSAADVAPSASSDLGIQRRNAITRLITLAVVILISWNASAATYYSRQSGAWNANTTWSTTAGHAGGAVGVGVFPVAGDIVFIGGSDAITVPHSATLFGVAQITISDDGSTCSLTIGDNTNSNNASLTVSTSITINTGGSVIVGGTINNAGRTATLTGAGAMTLNGTGTLQIGNTSTQVSTVSLATYTLNGTSSITVGSNSNASHVLSSTGAVSIGAGTNLSAGGDTGGTHTINFQSTLTNAGTITFDDDDGVNDNDQITMTVTGTSNNTGTMIFGRDAGVKTFVGALANSGTFDATGMPTTGNLVFRTGVSSTAGAFTAGGATFNDVASNAVSIGGTAAMSFANVVTLTDGSTAGTLVLTNSNTNTVTFSGTGAAQLTGTAGATWTQGTNSALSYAGTSITSITLDGGTNSPNTVTYTGASPAIFPATYTNLTVNSTGTATVGGATTVNSTMTVSSAVTNNSTLTVTTALSGASTLTQGASSILNIGGTSGITGLTANGATNTVNYTGTAQTIKTPTANTYSSLGLSGSGNKTFGASFTISANLSITGAVADLGTFTTHTAVSLTLGGIGQLSSSHGSTSSSATYKNNTYFLSTATGRVNVTTCTAPSTGTATTYYSRNATSGGNWDDNNSWTTSSDGTGGPLATGVWPRPYDNVVIRSGHTITVNSITDNIYCGISPDGLGNSLIGAGGGAGFNGSNVAMFYQTGDIAINGTLSVTSGINMMVAGYTRITSTGTFGLSSYLVNIGYLEADASSTLTTLDDLSLSGNSTTIINTTATSADDLNLDHTSATLCGTGTQGLLNSGGSAINYTNSATVAQICTSFTVTCSGGGCSGFPVVGTTSVILGNIGPGGVGNSSSNRMWLRANDLSLANGASVSAWSDVSGNSLSATATLTERPTFITNSVNGFPSISFDGSNDYLNLGTPAGLNFVPGTHSWSFLAVYSAPTNGFSTTPNQGTLFAKAYNTPDTRNYHYQIDDTPTTGTVNFAAYIGNGLTGGGPVVNTSAFFVSSCMNNTATKTSFTNETSNFSGVAISAGSDLTTTVLIGARRTTATAGTGFLYTGNIAELMTFSGELNAAQRIIATNYLASKYNITLSANDFHTMDSNPNGDYDYEVAGIGQATDGSNHKDGKGSGIVRMWNPNGLANGEFLLWGHDNATLVSSTTTVGLAGVDGTVIKERLVRKWRVSEIGGDVGTISISFDLSSFPASLGSNLRLLIDRDGDGFGDNDVTPVSGSLVGTTVIFSGVNFQSGDRFTLGNTDLSTPLPIELLDFSATPTSDNVVLNWNTASELNNDFFTVERSSGGEVFSSIGNVNGKGTTNHGSKYSLIDYAPISGIAYYRLKQTDLDGTFTYSKIIDVNYQGSTVPVMDVFPNPSAGNEFNIKITGLKNIDSVPVVMYDQLGREYMRLLLTVDKNSCTASKTFTPEKALPQGMYVLKAGTTRQLTKRFVVKSK